ncbi:exoglucanase 2 precursor [Pochonia chlamydosporia 170]|uniref:Glucanase n=1 Tax=Pochonia chlamydosporia 170 TaxID=1380566 RepID=A0A179FKZ4_METCM|nr:exoglucanase 2 precursor [Pochonia chlamydosporia 170]OAQ66252.1 exoglucanase 2 precursor [Pochonia chlamydosporia 170]
MAGRTFITLAAFASLVACAPAETRQNCATTWGQCGGQDWSGPTCCPSGSTCVAQNSYYSQCLPGAQSSSSSRPPTSTSSQATSTKASTTTSSAGTGTTSAPPVGSGTATWKGNPYSGVDLWANAFYASEVSSLAIPSLTGAMATAAAAAAKVPSFMWMDTLSKTPLMEQTLADIRAANKKGGNYAGQFVVYDLPDRDCAAAASNGEYSIADGGVAKYKNYIDTIRKIVTTYSDIRILLVIEPDSLANLVTNLNVAKCSNAKSAYLECVNYAITQLNLPNVAMYLDAGHAGWLGWPANQDPAAQLYAQVYKDAGSPSSLRGLATNVANYNAWDISSAPSYTQGNAVYDEKLFIHALGPLLTSHGWSGAHFITDQGRSGKQPTGQSQWGDWCNAKGTGFGIRPSANTGDELLDAFVWVKPGGESDGTSDTSAARYDYHCGMSDALQPAPEAGTWFQAYFVQLLTNANPSFL